MYLFAVTLAPGRGNRMFGEICVSPNLKGETF
jgi:hypothetical protein